MNEATANLLENAPPFATATAELSRWSENYDQPTPYTLFLDLIGWSGETYGSVGFFPAELDKPQADIPENAPAYSAWSSGQGAVSHAFANLIDQRLGALELGMLADALGEYALRPDDVTNYVDSLEAASMGDES